MLRGHSTFGFGFGLASPRRSSCARWGDVGCAVSVRACPSLVVRAAPAARTAYAASAKSAALAASGEPLTAATDAYHWPASDPVPTGRFSELCPAFSSAAPPRMLTAGSSRSAARSTPSSWAARPRVSSDDGTVWAAPTPSRCCAGLSVNRVASTRFIGPYPPLVLCSPAWPSHRVWEYDTASSRAAGTPNSLAAAAKACCRASGPPPPAAGAATAGAVTVAENVPNASAATAPMARAKCRKCPTIRPASRSPVTR